MNSIIKTSKNKLLNFTNSLVDNDVLDIFLKYQGITTLTTATLVPIALLMGNKVFKDTIKDTIKLKKKLPIIDDPLIGNYIKLSGLATLSSLTPYTLVPLGVLMLVYNIYNTQKTNEQIGGDSQQIIELPNYFKTLWNNRILDLLVKYQGIKLLTPSTLVPFALLLGRDMLEETLKNNQTGGGILPDDLPVIDDPLLGNYLKLMGLSTLTLAPTTLVPLGLLSILYDLYLK